MVHERACGTGYWTRRVAEVVTSIDPSDGTPEVVEEARRRGVAARIGDAWEPPPEGAAVLAMFWFSHLRLAERPGWLAAMGAGPLFLADNTYVPGLGGELVEAERGGAAGEPAQRAGSGGDRWKRREEAGQVWEIVKNYPEDAELRALFPGAELRRGRWYWWLWRG